MEAALKRARAEFPEAHAQMELEADNRRWFRDHASELPLRLSAPVHIAEVIREL